MAEPNNGRVQIIDVDMPFGSMVKFMIKWSIAAIPAVIILMIIGTLVGLVLGSITTAMIARGESNGPEAIFSPEGVDTSSGYASYLDSPVTSETPAWTASESRNPIDDSPTVVLSLSAASPASTLVRPAPSLIIRCRSNRTEAYITWNEYLGLDDIEITTRVGREAAVSRDWGLSTDSRASFVPGSAVAFVKQLMTADTLIAQATPYGESPITATFVVSGLSEEITPLREACNW